MASGNLTPKERLSRVDVPSLTALLPATISSGVGDVIYRVHDEFGSKADLFIPIVVRMDRREGTEFEATKSPGVYVFIHEDSGYLKVGKSHSNASKRALQHCGNDNTSSKDGTIQMAQLQRSNKTYLLIFALQKQDSMHWVLALEHYLEKILKPRITSHRNG